MQQLKSWLYKHLALVTLIVLSLLFVSLGLVLRDGFWSSLVINMAATSIYVLIAYFTYDAAKTFANREATKELQEYAESYIQPYIFSLQWSLMKLFFGSEEAAHVSLLDPLERITKDDIRHRLREKEFLGFDILQSSTEISRGIQELVENSFLLTRLSDDQLIMLVKVKNRIERLWIELSELSNLQQIHKPVSKNLRVVKGSEISSYNETLPNRRILLEMIGDTKEGVVVAFGDFDPRIANEQLLQFYKLKDPATQAVADGFAELFTLLAQWWTRYTKRGLVLRVR